MDTKVKYIPWENIQFEGNDTSFGYLSGSGNVLLVEDIEPKIDQCFFTNIRIAHNNIAFCYGKTSQNDKCYLVTEMGNHYRNNEDLFYAHLDEFAFDIINAIKYLRNENMGLSCFPESIYICDGVAKLNSYYLDREYNTESAWKNVLTSFMGLFKYRNTEKIDDPDHLIHQLFEEFGPQPTYDEPLFIDAYDGKIDRIIFLKQADTRIRYKQTRPYNGLVLYHATLLHFAALRGHNKVVDTLIEKGCNVDAVDHAGNTALHYAVMNTQIETIRLLRFKGGARNSIKNKYGWIPSKFMECCRSNGDNSYTDLGQALNSNQ